MFSDMISPRRAAIGLLAMIATAGLSATSWAQALPSVGSEAHSSTTGPSLSSSASTADAKAATVPVVHRIQGATERMEMTANTSRLLTMDQSIPRVVISNPDVVEATALSPNEIQILAKKPGITQINLWNEKGQIYTVDCIVSADARELIELLRTEFPNANVRVRPIGQGVALIGYTDRADQVNQMIAMAKAYYPEVQSNIQVLGVQQIQLKCKVAEVSRTKLRNLGVDFASVGNFASFGNMMFSTAGGVVSASQFFDKGLAAPMVDTMRFGVINGQNTIYGFIDALQQENLAKILAEPVMVTYSGRPAQFVAGGEIPYPAATSINGVSVAWKKTGVTVDMVPIVLGNGNIRLEVRPLVRELDRTRTVEISPGVFAPAFTERYVDTGVEMQPGQTLALAGLVSTREEALKSGLPWLSDLPYLGVPFRRTRNEKNELELLIVVTPELVAPLDACDAPKCLPGMHSDTPNTCEILLKGYMEVPSKGPCGPGGVCGPEGPLPPGIVTDGAAPGAIYEGSPINGLPPGASGEVISPGTPVPGSSVMPSPMSGAAAGRPSAQSPAMMANRYSPTNAQDPRAAARGKGPAGASGFIGDIGYDLSK